MCPLECDKLIVTQDLIWGAAVRSKREQLQIIREILNMGSSASRTRIRLFVGLTAEQSRRYVGFMVKRGLLEELPKNGCRSSRFAVTPKGERLLSMIDELVQMPGFDILDQP